LAISALPPYLLHAVSYVDEHSRVGTLFNGTVPSSVHRIMDNDHGGRGITIISILISTGANQLESAVNT